MAHRAASLGRRLHCAVATRTAPRPPKKAPHWPDHRIMHCRRGSVDCRRRCVNAGGRRQRRGEIRRERKSLPHRCIAHDHDSSIGGGLHPHNREHREAARGRDEKTGCEGGRKGERRVGGSLRSAFTRGAAPCDRSSSLVFPRPTPRRLLPFYAPNRHLKPLTPSSWAQASRIRAISQQVRWAGFSAAARRRGLLSR